MYRSLVIGFEQVEQQPGGTHDLYASVPDYIEAIAELNWKAFRGVAFHIKGFQSRHISYFIQQHPALKHMSTACGHLESIC